ncbi:MAG: MBL fold metallo-hydrolase [Candidatus Moraniibacteriota bacterium]|nr:MAG: MBL fold metallo-hydrolase [Candidatus Moranbacteria bacterium]
MNIQYYGDFCFKITTKPGGRATEEIIIVTDPPPKESGLRAPQGKAHILLKTHAEENDRPLEAEAIFDCPGEYDVKGVTFFGLPSFRDETKGETRGQNTLFVVQSEEISLCHIGALGHELSSSTIEKIGHVDILFVPIGNHDTLAISNIDELIRKIEPSIVIPMHYKIPGFATNIEDRTPFCKEIGNCPESVETKLTVKKKDLEGKNMEVVLLERA